MKTVHNRRAHATPLIQMLAVSSSVFLIVSLYIFFKHSIGEYKIVNYDIFTYTVVITFAISYFFVCLYSAEKAIQGTSKEKAGGFIVLMSLFLMSILFLIEVQIGHSLASIPAIPLTLVF